MPLVQLIGLLCGWQKEMLKEEKAAGKLVRSPLAGSGVGRAKPYFVNVGLIILLSSDNLVAESSEIP